VRLSYDPPLDPSAYRFTHRVRVRFAETDAMGIVHHAAYLPYLESARVEYMREIGHPYSVLREEGTDIAVLEAYVRYLRALRFDDEVDVHVVPASATRSTIQLGYLLTCGEVAAATAVTIHGCVDQRGRPTRMPAWLKELPAT
jgi:acyl-CoA thioester hydrolase